MSDDIRLRYIGDGFLPGVPARDLTEAEAREYGGVRELVKSGLYESVTAKGDAASNNDKAAAADTAGKDGV